MGEKTSKIPYVESKKRAQGILVVTLTDRAHVMIHSIVKEVASMSRSSRRVQRDGLLTSRGLQTDLRILL